MFRSLCCHWLPHLGSGFGWIPQDFAWVQSVYDLSYLHHGSPLRRPRLPITTHFADRLAYVLASAGEDGAAWDRILAQWSPPWTRTNVC